MPGNIHDVPIAVIESWPAPNFVNPVRRNWMPAYAITLQVLTTILVSARFWSRLKRQAGGFGTDDSFILLAWIFATLLTTLFTIGAKHYGFDRHVWDVHYNLFVSAAFVGWLAEVSFLISTCSTKISVLLFYRRMVLGSYSKKWKWATWVAIAFCAAYCLAFILTLFLICSPLDAYWKAFDLTYTGKYHCANTSVSNPFVGTLSVVTDIYSVVLPGILLRNLRIPIQQKIGLNIIFGLGALVAIAGVVRTYYLTLLSGDDYDTTWTGFNIFIWSQLECQLAIICACAPCLKALFTRYMGESQGRVYNRSNKSTPKISPGTTKSDGWGPLYPTNERPPLRQIDSDRTLVKPSLEVTEEVELPSWTASAHSLATDPQREHKSSDP
ncbi:hypothetical protein LTR66_003038 [Elasticomyces elasticus]|nr:hypothetical protein LTR66_003038 [Elasticomyces elasticus]